jgi:hypothetical protein
MLLFDQIFYHIAPTRRYNNSIQDSTIELEANSLNDSQCNAISQLSGYLIYFHEQLLNRKLSHLQANSVLAGLSVESSTSSKSYSLPCHVEQKICLLQEYLVNELVRADELEQEVQKLEANLVEAIAQKEKLEKTVKNLLPGSGDKARGKFKGSDSKTSTSDLTQHLGCFVRKTFGPKQFFGLIANSNSPFYQVCKPFLSL